MNSLQVKEALKIPILGLFDSDAHGLKILSVYAPPNKRSKLMVKLMVKLVVKPMVKFMVELLV